MKRGQGGGVWGGGVEVDSKDSGKREMVERQKGTRGESRDDKVKGGHKCPQNASRVARIAGRWVHA